MISNDNKGNSPSLTVTFTGCTAECLSHVEDPADFVDYLVMDFFVTKMIDRDEAVHVLKKAGFTANSVQAVCDSVEDYEFDLSSPLSSQFALIMSDPELGERMAEEMGVPPYLWVGLIELLLSDEPYCESDTAQASWCSGPIGEVSACALFRMVREYRNGPEGIGWFAPTLNNWDRPTQSGVAVRK